MKSIPPLMAIMALAFLIACSKGDKYRDGQYVAASAGHSDDPPITVEVTIAAGNIVDVQILQHGESVERVPQSEEALNTLPGAIVKKNATTIDGIAGATETSDGIKNAVESALKKAQ